MQEKKRRRMFPRGNALFSLLQSAMATLAESVTPPPAQLADALDFDALEKGHHQKQQKQRSSSRSRGSSPKEPSWATGVVACGAYSCMSLATTLSNKALLSSFGFTHSFALLLWQYVATVALALVCRRLGFVPRTSSSSSKTQQQLWSWRVVVKWLPLNALFFAMLLSNTYALRWLSVPMVTVVKAVSTALTGLGDALIYGQPLGPGVLASILLMVASALVAGLNDLAFNALGYFFAGVNCISTTAYVLYMRKALRTLRIGEFDAVLLNNALSIPLLVPFLLLFNELLPALSSLQNASGWFWLVFALNGVSGFVLSLTSFWCVNATSPTTYAMVGSLNKVPLTIVGWLLFSAPMTGLGVVSVATSIAGGLLYSAFKSREKLHK